MYEEIGLFALMAPCLTNSIIFSGSMSFHLKHSNSVSHWRHQSRTAQKIEAATRIHQQQTQTNKRELARW